VRDLKARIRVKPLLEPENGLIKERGEMRNRLTEIKIYFYGIAKSHCERVFSISAAGREYYKITLYIRAHMHCWPQTRIEGAKINSFE